MADVNEIRALKAAFLGALDAARALEAMKSRVIDIEPDADIATGDLEELGRLTLAQAVASQALRGLVEAIRARRAVG
jgi:hypothetical protein